MAWQDEMVPIVRYLVNDVANVPPTYSDDRLEQTIVIAALLIKFDISFDQHYTVGIAAGCITPDPTTVILPNGHTRDDAFIKLVSLKAVIIILKGEAQVYALSAVRIVDGPSTIDFTEVGKAIQKRLDTIIKEYEEARLQYQAGNRTGFGITQLHIDRDFPSFDWRY